MSSFSSEYKACEQRYKKMDYTRPHWWTSCEDLVVDFSSSSSSTASEDPPAARRLPLHHNVTEGAYAGPIYGLSDVPGFVYAPDALSSNVQERLAFRCLSSYCEAPHRTNMDGSPSKCPEKISWSTMGYNYDWTLRKYYEEQKSPFPVGLAHLSRQFARLSGDGDFSAQASIVNYYSRKSIMGGHRDDLELTFDKPVVSMSCGLPAIFLLGGYEKSDKAIPILVRAGDVMIMGGESRLRFHGVAKILDRDVSLPARGRSSGTRQIMSLEPDDINLDSCGGDEHFEKERDRTLKFLEDRRININIRQVLPDGKESLGGG